MTERTISKALISREDLALGQGPVSQTRQGNSVSVNQIDLPWVLTSISEIQLLDPAKYNHCTYKTSLISRNYRYDSTSAAVIDNYRYIDSVPGTGQWVLISDEKRVPYTVVNYTELRALDDSLYEDGAIIKVIADGSYKEFKIKTGVKTDNGDNLLVFTSNNNRYAEALLKGNSLRAILGEGPFVVVGTGQSNMVGRIAGGTYKVSTKVQLWEPVSGEFVTADFQNNDYNVGLPTTGADSTANSNNVGIAFCHRLAEETGEDVYYILGATGGTSITNWGTAGTFTAALKTRIANALAAIPNKNNVDVLIWLQGEKDLNNGTMSFTQYATYFQEFLASMDSESYYSKETTPIITAPISRDYIANNDVTKPDVQEFLASLGTKFKSKYGNTCIANVLNLTLGDVAHYDGPSIYELGYNRFRDALLKINEQGNIGDSPQALSSAAIIDLGNDNLIGGRASSTLYSSATWADGNIGLGRSAYRFVTTAGESNIGFGESAYRGYDTLGDSNINIGLTLNTDLSDPNNTGAGPQGVMGDQNTLVGIRCAAEISGGTFTNNTILGFSNALETTSLDDDNVLVGSRIARVTNIGSDNVLIGNTVCSDDFADVGDRNVAIGLETLGGSATAGTLGSADTRHTALGAFALSHLNTANSAGESNTCIGAQAGRNLQSSSPMTSAVNVTCLGQNTAVSGNNQVQIGDSATTTYVYGTVQNRSDERDKADIQDISDDHVAFYMDIEWKLFRWDMREDYWHEEFHYEEEDVEEIATEEILVPKLNSQGYQVENPDGSLVYTKERAPIIENGVPKKVLVKKLVRKSKIIKEDRDGRHKRSRLHVGAIAQQVEEVMQKHNIDFAGLQHHSKSGGDDVYSIGYDEFIGLQGKIIQKQQRTIDSILARLDALENES